MKFFSFNKSHISVFITILFIVFVASLYLFIYLPHNEKLVHEQRFRSLQTIDQNIHAKIDNSLALMNNLLIAYQTDSTKAIDYIKSYPKEKFSLEIPTTKTSRQPGTRAIADSGYLITVNNVNQLITLQLQKENIAGADTVFFQLSMQVTFQQFIRSLLPENVFDQYVVFSNKDVVFETFPSGIGSILDTALVKEKALISSGINSINASGIDYKMFLQPVSFTANQKWMLAGLLTNKRYQQEKNQVPTGIIMLLVTAMLIIVVSFPWIKLYQMGNKDQLTTTDGIASIVVAMLLMSLLFFSFYKYNRYLRPVESYDSKGILAKQITTAFEEEIESAYTNIQRADAFIASTNFTNDVSKMHDTASTTLRGWIDSIPALKTIIADTSISQIYWLYPNGEEAINWIAADKNAPHGNFAHRDYYKKILQKKGYFLDYDTSKTYYLDQVTSWVSGNFTSVVAIPSKKPGLSVAAISLNLKSLNRPVLPTGYQFAIIDNAANVLYHSDVSRNLNENLVTEFSESAKLTSCLKARTEDVFSTKYFSKDYNILYRPLNRLPYSIIIFSDLSYKAARDMEIYGFTILMLMLLFAILFVQLLIVFMVSSKKSYFKNQFLNSSWIGPKRTSHDQYNLAILFNVLMILLALVFLNVTAFLAYLYILLFSVTFISVFLNLLFKRRYLLNKQTDNYRFKKITIGWLIGFISIVNLTALKTLDFESTIVFFTYELLACIIAHILYSRSEAWVTTIITKFTIPTTRWNFSTSFALMSLTRLIITSGIPVAFLYISSYNYEQNISIRFRQLQYADQLLTKLPAGQLDNVNNNTRYDRGFYNDSAWIHDLSLIKNAKPEHYSEEDSITARILGMFRVNFTSISVYDSKFYISHASDTSFFYNPLLKDATKRDRGTITYRRTNNAGTYLKLTGSSLNYRSPTIAGPFWFNGLVFWILLLAAIVAFYFIIRNILNKLFALKLQDLSIWQKLDDEVISSNELSKLLFIIGLPGSGKLSNIKQKIKSGELKDGDTPLVFDEANPKDSNVKVVDMIVIPDIGTEKERTDTCAEVITEALGKEYKLVIVNHFEYNIQDVVTNRIKLNFLEKLMLENKSKVIILSTIHPITFLDSVLAQPATNNQSVTQEDLERWHVLLGHFRIVIFALDAAPAPSVEDENFGVMKETQYTHFLNKMQDSVVRISTDWPAPQRTNNADQLAFKLQVTSHYFYMYIWQSLTKEEKFLLYDLAEDNLVNSFDNYNLSMLLAKGVISHPDGTLQLFNRGFRNFILTAIGNSEAMKIKNQIKDNGNWSSLKSPLLIVLLAILTFLLTVQEEAYSKIIACVAALGTGVPAILKLFSFFDKSDSAK